MAWFLRLQKENLRPFVRFPEYLSWRHAAPCIVLQIGLCAFLVFFYAVGLSAILRELRGNWIKGGDYAEETGGALFVVLALAGSVEGAVCKGLDDNHGYLSKYVGKTHLSLLYFTFPVTTGIIVKLIVWGLLYVFLVPASFMPVITESFFLAWAVFWVAYPLLFGSFLIDEWKFFLRARSRKPKAGT